MNRLEEAFEYKANPNKCWDKNETALEARIRFNKDIWSARVIQSFNSLNEGPNLNFNVTSGNKKSEFLKEEIKKQMARANHSISQISIYSNDPKLKRWLSRLMSQLDKSQLAFQSNSIYHPDSIQQIFNSASCLKLANIKLKMALEDSDRSEIFIDPSVVVQYSKDLGESANGLSNIFNYSPSLENCVLD